MKEFLKSLGYVHREAWMFLFACPLLASIPMVLEFAQHVVELRAGMYVDPAGALAAEADPLRMQFGFAKIVAISLPIYWVTRFLHGARDGASARSFDKRAAWLFAGVLAFSLADSAISLFVLPQTAGWMASGMVAGFFIIALLARWQAAAPLGVFISPLRSAEQMMRHLPWSVAFTIAAMLPVMALHYGLAIIAITAAPDWIDWILMIADSIVVSWLAGILAASNYVIALRAGAFAEGEPNPA